jgi:hypothetical protein
MGLRTALGLKKPKFNYIADGLAVRGQILSAMQDDQKFVAAWETSLKGCVKSPPDIRWRALTCVTAARQALLAEGDFVECGVNAGLYSMMVCRYLDFGKINREFLLFDTFSGIPLDGLSGKELDRAQSDNSRRYTDVYDVAKKNFSPWPNVRLIRGPLPTTLDEISDKRRIAYLSIDLNSSSFEMQVIERLWPSLSPGAVIVLDDYGWENYRDSFNAWNNFAAKVGRPIFQLPTGQGLIWR